MLAGRLLPAAAAAGEGFRTGGQVAGADHPNSVGHHKEWIEACKNGGATTCNFDYSGALTEAVLLGTVSYRTGKPIVWDGEKLKARTCPRRSGSSTRRTARGGKWPERLDSSPIVALGREADLDFIHFTHCADGIRLGDWRGHRTAGVLDGFGLTAAASAYSSL